MAKPIVAVKTLEGRTKGQEGWGLGAVEVDVPPSLSFYDAGSQQTLGISAEFPNGDEFEVVNSTFLKLVSENPKVVKIGPEGWVTAFGPGSTSITATYTIGEKVTRTSIPVSVTVPGSSFTTPISLDFGDQPAGTTSQPQQVVFTNRSNSPIKIYKLEIRAEVRETDNCTSVPLAPGDTCTISVVYAPYRAAPSIGQIYIPNSHTGMLTIPIYGNGT